MASMLIIYTNQATVRISNSQMYRQIMSPGWTLGWTWAKKEVIWSMVGAQAIDQGDCSNFKGNNIPHSCENSPAIVDLLSGGVPINQQFAGCCKGGVLAPLGQLDRAAAVSSSFQVSVGHSGTTKKTVKVPKDFYFLGPGAGYSCSSAMIVPSSIFFSSDGRRKTRAMSELVLAICSGICIYFRDGQVRSLVPNFGSNSVP